ncbi:MAG TPA: CD225/dispanin family protein [Verrucomicrobiae bacterium]|jgi:hypothetical protein
MYKIIGADREEYGPVSADQIRAWLIEGRADGRTMAQAAGSVDWRPLSAFPEFEAALAGASAARASAPPPVTPPVAGASLPSDVPTYLLPAILITVLCACVLGFPAVYFSTQVMSKLNRGDVEGAREASKKARVWCWVGFCLGALLFLYSIYVLRGWWDVISHTFQ